MDVGKRLSAFRRQGGEVPPFYESLQFVHCPDYGSLYLEPPGYISCVDLEGGRGLSPPGFNILLTEPC